MAEPAAMRVASFPSGLPPVPLKQSSSPVSPDLPLCSKDPREHRGQKGRPGNPKLCYALICLADDNLIE